MAMNVWSKLLTAVRGGINEIGEAVADSQALRILDQEIRDTDEELRRTRESLAEMIARRKMADDALRKLDTEIAEYEGYAIKALQMGNDDLGREVAKKIASLETERRTESDRVKELAEGENHLRKIVNQTENTIRRLKQQVDTVRATESVQRAQMTVARRYGGKEARLQTALDSLERIKKRQAGTAAGLEASEGLAEENDEDELKAKLKASGIIVDETDTDSVLARLKEKLKKT